MNPRPSTSRRFSEFLIRRRIDLSEGLRRILGPQSVLAGLAAVVYSVCQLLQRQDVGSDQDWELWAPLGTLAFTSGALALIGVFVTAVGYAKLTKRRNANDELATCCKGVWAVVVEETGINMKSVGVNIWAVKGLPGVRFLDRRASFAIVPRPRTRITWSKGKGAIGLAWTRDAAIAVDMRDLESRARNAADFAQLTEDDRYGLSWEEMTRLRRYRSVLALPLRAGKDNAMRVRAVLAVDLLEEGHLHKLNELHDHPDIQGVLSTCESVLGRS